MSEEEKILTVELERIHDYSFKVDFGGEGFKELITDEKPPVGEGSGPDPSMLLAAAMGNCLSSSLLFCLQRYHKTYRYLLFHVIIFAHYPFKRVI